MAIKTFRRHRVGIWRGSSLASFVSIACAALALATFASAADAEGDVDERAQSGRLVVGAHGNANIVSSAVGAYAYRTLSTGELRGAETFQVIEHPDGHRTASAVTDIFSRDVHVFSTVRVDSDFRPLDAYVSIRTQGQLKGAGLFSVEEDGVRSNVMGPSGADSSFTPMPSNRSLVTHPIAMDGWHFWYADAKEGAVTDGALLFIDGAADFEAPMRGALVEAPITGLGEQTIVTPAGSFETRGFRIADHSEIWITGPHNLVVRYTWEGLDREYILERFEETAP